jgi:outer membrane autotransporter protein
VSSLGVLQTPLNPVYNAVLHDDAAQARAAFVSLSGEVHASVKTVLVDDSQTVRSAVIDRLRGSLTSVSPDSHTDIWAHVLGSWGNIDGDGNASAVDHSTTGIMLGADQAFGDDRTIRLGILAGYSRTNLDISAVTSRGNSDNYNLVSMAAHSSMLSHSVPALDIRSTTLRRTGWRISRL